ncbi:hypothetical protein [Aestuariibaculum marinum]|uniref:Uncharacterized protein n=1 Tax=Aestuariibaculum marinum TaxID=2683592 RepID=A0A8J6U458_9FLAO|nr:hypothetical protein [Aestuariibaculum marinum]MBD0822614.1 hypothetical protein [Aestuariibaculum marinum]
MTLGFSTQIKKKPAYFVEKIWEAILQKGIQINANDFIEYGRKCLPKNYIVGTHNPKLHTIREDSRNRWKAGNDIHFVTGNRTKNRQQFAPVIKVKSIQKIEIKYPAWSENLNDPVVSIDGRTLSLDETQQLAWNDGFENLISFWLWFNEDFTGKIIHWTDLKY